MPKFTVTLTKRYNQNGEMPIEAASEQDAIEKVFDLMGDPTAPLQTTDPRICWLDLTCEDGSFEVLDAQEGEPTDTAAPAKGPGEQAQEAYGDSLTPTQCTAYKTPEGETIYFVGYGWIQDVPAHSADALSWTVYGNVLGGASYDLCECDSEDAAHFLWQQFMRALPEGNSYRIQYAKEIGL